MKKKNIFDRMMKFQVKFCNPSELRLWRTGMLLLTKLKGHKSNAHCQWMYKYLFHSLKFNFEWPSKAFISCISIRKTLYVLRKKWMNEYVIQKEYSYIFLCESIYLPLNILYIFQITPEQYLITTCNLSITLI